MANEFTDGIPDISIPIPTNVEQMQKSLGFLKETFEQLCTGWSDSSVSNLKVDNINDTYTVGDASRSIVLESLWDVSTVSLPITPNCVYKIHYRIKVSDAQQIRVGLNDIPLCTSSWSMAFVDGDGNYYDQSSTSASNIPVTYYMSANMESLGSIVVSTFYNGGASLGLNSKFSNTNFGGAFYGRGDVGGIAKIDSSTVITSMNMYVGAGTMTGNIVFERLV